MATFEAREASHAQQMDVEDQAPLLVASSRPSARVWRWRGLAVATVGILALAAVATVGVRSAMAMSQSSTSSALTGLEEVKAKKSEAPAEGKKENKEGKEKDDGAVEAALKEGKIDMAYLQGVKKGLAMHGFEATGKDDKTMSVKKGEVVYLESKKKEDEGEKKEGWVWAYKMSGESGFVPRDTLNFDFKDCVNSFKPAGEKADKQLDVKAGEPVWLQHEDKEWALVYKPGKEGEILSGYVPQWSLHATKATDEKKSEKEGKKEGEKEKKEKKEE